jgi:prolyl-tRNA synthetase
VLCPACGYGADRRAAALHKRLFPEEPERIEMVQTPGTSTIAALTELLDIPARKTAKVVFSMGCFADPQDCTKCYEKLVTAVIRGDLEVEQRKLQHACEARSLRPASEEEITACGMSPGYGSPIGAWNTVVIVDDSAAGSNNLAAGANRPDYHFLNTNFARDYLGSVADIAAAREGDACSECGEPLTLKSGIHLGHLSLPGTRYTAAMGAYYQDGQGSSRPIQMGAGTVDLDRLLGALAEEHHDQQGLRLPPAAAPFQVHIVDLLSDPAEAEALSAELESASLTVLLDDRKESAGVKFNDADLLGMPLRITVGSKALQEGQVEFHRRADGETWRVARSEAAEAARNALFSSD